jgi:hypothetical protein
MHRLFKSCFQRLMRGRRLKAPASAVTAMGATQIMITILVVILLLVALGALPAWPYSRGWGYYPSSGLGLVVVVLVILLLLGRL